LVFPNIFLLFLFSVFIFQLNVDYRSTTFSKKVESLMVDVNNFIYNSLKADPARRWVFTSTPRFTSKTISPDLHIRLLYKSIHPWL